MGNVDKYLEVWREKVNNLNGSKARFFVPGNLIFSSRTEQLKSNEMKTKPVVLPRKLDWTTHIVTLQCVQSVHIYTRACVHQVGAKSRFYIISHTHTHTHQKPGYELIFNFKHISLSLSLSYTHTHTQTSLTWIMSEILTLETIF